MYYLNCVPFDECISEMNKSQINNTKDLDILMPIYSLTEYSNNSLKTFGLLWQYCRDDPAVNDDGAIVKFIANTATSLVKIKGKKQVKPAMMDETMLK